MKGEGEGGESENRSKGWKGEETNEMKENGGGDNDNEDGGGEKEKKKENT